MRVDVEYVERTKVCSGRALKLRVLGARSQKKLKRAGGERLWWKWVLKTAFQTRLFSATLPV